MPFIVTLAKKTIRIENNEIKNIISYLNEALTGAGLTLIEDNKKAPSEIAPGEQRKRDGWWVSLVTERLESITGNARGSKECVFPSIRVNLDPPAMMLREAYIDYLNIILIEDGRSIEETENELIKSRTVLTREILIRMVTIALCTDMDATRDGEKIVKAIKNFCNLLTENGVLHKSY